MSVILLGRVLVVLAEAYFDFSQSTQMMIKESLHAYLKNLIMFSDSLELTKMGNEIMTTIKMEVPDLLNDNEIQRLTTLAMGKEKQHEEEVKLYEQKDKLIKKKAIQKRLNFKDNLKELNQNIKDKGLINVIRSKMKTFLIRSKQPHKFISPINTLRK